MARRGQGSYEFGAFRLIAEERVLLRQGQPVRLTPKVFETLLVLVENQGHLVDKETLIKRLWPDTIVEDQNLTYNIAVLRKILRDGANGLDYIETIPRVGYRFIAPVTKIPDVGTGVAPTRGVGKNVDGEVGVRGSEAGLPPRVRVREIAAGIRRRTTSSIGRAAVVLTGCALVGLSVLIYSFMRSPASPRVSTSVKLTHDEQYKVEALLTDGPRVYFNEFARPRGRLMSVPAETGETTTIQESSPAAATSVSPDGSKFVGYGGSDEALWVGPVAGGFARRLGLHGRYPAWSPDGTKIAYCNGDGLYVAGSDGSNARSLATLPGEPMYPRWSPDGRVIRITVVNANAATNSLWEVGADGTSNAHVILPGWSKHPHEAFGAWTPDGKYFVFQSRQDGSTDIWAIREKCGVFRRNCGVPVRLTQGPLSYSQPLPSRDGKKLFVLSEEKHPELFRYDLKSKELLSYPFKTPITEIEYSRDARRVAYVTYPGYILWCSKADGSESRQLTPRSMEAHQPHWSPDGKQIAFMAVYPDSRYKMCLISPDGGEYQEVFPGGGQEGAPTWSKDGKKLVYGDVFSRQDSSNMSIHVFDLTSRNASTLPQSSGLWSPRWSPDGRYISAVAVGSPPAVLLYDCTSQKWTRLATVDTIDDEPTWSGDSAYIYFISSDSGLSRYYRVRIGDGRTEPLISLPGNSLDPWGGVTPDGVPLVSRINRVQEIYAMHVEWP